MQTHKHSHHSGDWRFEVQTSNDLQRNCRFLVSRSAAVNCPRWAKWAINVITIILPYYGPFKEHSESPNNRGLQMDAPSLQGEHEKRPGTKPWIT